MTCVNLPHYVIVLPLNGNCSNDERLFFRNSLKSTSSVQICFVNSTKCDYQSLKSFDSILKQFDQIWDEVLNDCRNVSSQINSAYSTVLHKIADNLPPSGSCLVDVIALMFHSSFSLEDNISLFGALSRLHFWKNANIQVYSGKSSINIDEWKEMLFASEYRSESFDDIWRGGIFFGDQTQVDQCLTAFSLQPTSECVDEFTEKGKSFNFGAMNNDFIIYDWISILDECLLDSVPEYLISDKSFNVNLNSHSDATENSQHFIDHLQSNPHITYIVSIKSYIVKKSFRSYLDWKESNEKYSYQLPYKMENNLLYGKQFFLLSCFHQKNSKLLLRTLNNRQDLNFSLSQDLISIKTADTFKKNGSNIEKNMLDSLFLPNDISLELMRKLCEVKIQCNEKNLTSPFILIKELWKVIMDYTNNKFPKLPDECSPLRNMDELLVFEDQIDANDWPERKALLQRVLKKEPIRRYSSLDTMGTIEPPVRDSLTIPLDAKEFLKYFKKCGEPTEIVKKYSTVINPSVNEKLKCPRHTFPEEETNWPESISSPYHDTYYNVGNKAEEKEKRLQKMKNRYLPNETVSTCCDKTTTDKNFISIKTKTENTKSEFLRRSPRKLSSRTKSNPKVMGKLSNSKDKSRSMRKKMLSEKHKMKLRCCIAEALEKYGITVDHESFKNCGKKLFAVCLPFVNDVIGCGSTSNEMRKICNSHVKQVIQFEFGKLGKSLD